MSKKTLSIEQCENGYILREEHTFASRTVVYKELADLFGELLLRFEGRCPSFGGNSYGEVAIFRVKEKGK